MTALSRTGTAPAFHSVVTPPGSRSRTVSSTRTSFEHPACSPGPPSDADPRITLGVPIIGSPSTHALLAHRAQNLPAPAGPIPLAAPYFPQSLLAAFDRLDPASPSLSLERWRGKRILVLSGEQDQLVNFVHGRSGEFVEKIKGVEGCHVEAWVQPKA